MKEIPYIAITEMKCSRCGLNPVGRSLLLPNAGAARGEDLIICPPCLMNLIGSGEFAVLYDPEENLKGVVERIEDNEVTCRNCSQVVTEAPECDDCRKTCESCGSLDADEERYCASCYNEKEAKACRDCGSTNVYWCDECHTCENSTMCPNCESEHEECENCIRCSSCAEAIVQFEQPSFICPACREEEEQTASVGGVENTAASSVVKNGLGDEIEVAW